MIAYYEYYWAYGYERAHKDIATRLLNADFEIELVEKMTELPIEALEKIKMDYSLMMKLLMCICCSESI
jgi:hypothetical protein